MPFESDLKVNLEYLDDSHTYLYEGVILPSITTIIGGLEQFKDKYAGIPERVMERARQRGNRLHEIIEEYETQGIEEVEEEHKNFLLDYKFLKKMYKFKVLGCEIPVLLSLNGEVISAGRLDLLVENEDGKLGIVDFKSTSVLDKEYLTYQTNAYRMGYEQTYGKKIDFIASLWIYKGKRKYKELPINEDLINEMLEKEKGKN